MLENLQFISLGGLEFQLPINEELQNNLGGEGACVQVGYSLVNTNKTGL